MTNRLADATSPYLLQHKDNPVDWQEWGESAFAEARKRDVPVLLSVGYSACHWCHVMAHESFEDPETAALMNRMFVNVKVDREERPDVDSIYMEAVQAMTGRGGWPMTVWLAPDGKPFYAGTYFPDTDRHGLPSFRRVLEGISDAWRSRREELLDQSEKLTEVLQRPVGHGDLVPGPQALTAAYERIEKSFDAINGGFGGAPKFPQQPVLEFLLRVRRASFATRADEMLDTTLSEMAAGGIHDHLGGGFSRYSVDGQWLVPHFEKMLYDNAQLARIYLWAGIELSNPHFLDVARSTLDYLVTDLMADGGGFYSAEDADSEGEEGKFYVWSLAELRDVLGEGDAARAAHFFGVSEQGNFEGSNILHRPTTLVWDEEIESIRDRLLARRSTRVRPGRDDKIVTAWNGLAIRAFAEAGAALGEPRYVENAVAAAGFITSNLDVHGELMRSWRAGRTSVPGYVDDHAALAVGLFSLYEATGDPGWHRQAVDLVDRLEGFANEKGGYFTTRKGGETLLKRPIDQTDNPMPSGNAMAAEATFLAGLYTGRGDYHDRAEGALRSVSVLIDQYPSMVSHHLSVLASMERGPLELAVVGPRWRELAAVHWAGFRPHVVLAGGDRGDPEIPLLSGRGVQGETLAYVCRDFVCELPTSDPTELAAQLL